MHPAIDLLSRYAAHHRDQRNIATHFVAMPLLVFGLGLLMSRPTLQLDLPWASVTLTPAACAVFFATLWYLRRGGWLLGGAASAMVSLLALLAHQVAVASDHTLAWGLLSLGLGASARFIGHWYEGKKPTLHQDLWGLPVGAMFIAAEALFARGWNPPMQAEIERRAGPTFLRDMAV